MISDEIRNRIIELDGDTLIPNYKSNNEQLGVFNIKFMYTDSISEIEEYQYNTLQAYLIDEYKINEAVVNKIDEYIQGNVEGKSNYTITDIFIDYEHEDGVRRIGFIGDCDWEYEHGLGITLENEEVVEIGTQDIVL